MSTIAARLEAMRKLEADHLTANENKLKSSYKRILFIGSTVAILATGIFWIFCFLVCRYIKNIEKLERQLSETMERYNLAQRAGKVGVFEYRVPEGIIIWCPELDRRFGFPEGKFSGRYEEWTKRVHPDDLERIETLIRDTAMSRDKDQFSCEYRIVHPEGKILWARTDARLFKDDNGNFIRMIGTNIDISERKATEEILTKARADADMANQTKSRFIANMSHEIRTPLNAILGFSELLHAKNLPEEERLQFTSVIKRNGHHLVSLIEDILDISKLEAEKVKIRQIPFAINPFMEDIRSLMSKKAENLGLELVIEIKPCVPQFIKSDPTRVRQILTNVIGNAIKFSQGSGRVTVNVTYARQKNTVIFLVKDHGIGIDRTEREAIFEPFHQTDSSITRRFGGTGLGLTLSRSLSRLLGGDLFLGKSEPGAGSTFILRIPSEMEEEEKTAAKAAKDASMPGDLNGFRILLAEDTPDSAYLIKKMLEPLGVCLQIVDDGDIAVENASKRNFDVILMDIRMPRKDGLTATRELRSKGYKGPIIALTAHALSNEKQASIQAGCNIHLTKPVNFKELIAAIRKVGMRNIA
ncbi:MAG: response regulator [Oligoflexales bacterium]|nr:response regulator [Oligoflexales bacterium]